MKWIHRLFIAFLFLTMVFSALHANEQRKFDTDFLIHIRIYDEKDEKFSRELKQSFSESMDKFQRKMKQFPDIHVYVRISKDDEHFASLIKNRNKVLEFSEGFTDLRSKEIFLKNPRSIRNIEKYQTILLHEYIHLFVAYHWADAPLWFHEGMAVYFSEGISFERYSDFMSFYAYKPMNLIKDNPMKYPENPHFLSPYYFQSAQAIRKLYLDYPKQFESLWDFRRFDFETAFINAFNMSVYAFVKNFDEVIQRNFLKGIIFMVISVIWFAVPVLVIIGAIRKKRMNRKIINEWENEVLEDFEYIPYEEQTTPEDKKEDKD